MILGITVFALHYSLSIEFTGGVEMIVQTDSQAPVIQEQVTQEMQELGYDDILVQVQSQVDETVKIVANLGLTDDVQVKEASDQLLQVLQLQGVIQSEAQVSGLSLI